MVGALVLPSGPTTFPVHDPATGATIARLRDDDAEDALAAVAHHLVVAPPVLAGQVGEPANA